MVPEQSADEERKIKKDKLITVPLLIALILCLLVMPGVMNVIVEKFITHMT